MHVRLSIGAPALHVRDAEAAGSSFLAPTYVLAIIEARRARHPVEALIANKRVVNGISKPQKLRGSASNIRWAARPALVTNALSDELFEERRQVPSGLILHP